jgi:hypothetical protein
MHKSLELSSKGALSSIVFHASMAHPKVAESALILVRLGLRWTGAHQADSELGARQGLLVNLIRARP